MSILLLPIFGEDNVDRVAYVDIDLATGAWKDVVDGEEKLNPGRMLVAYSHGRVVQKVMGVDGMPRNVQYFEISNSADVLKWHGRCYPSVRGEVWGPVESDEAGGSRTGYLTSSDGNVDSIKVERLDVDGDLVAEEFYSSEMCMLERIEYGYNSAKEISVTRIYDRHGDLIGVDYEEDE